MGLFDLLGSVFGGYEPPVPISSQPKTPVTSSVSAQAEKPLFEIENGVLLKYNGSDGEAVIPDGVTIIGMRAFEGKLIKSISFPDSVIAIENYAFSRCVELVKADLPEKLQRIGMGAFMGCVSLKYMDIPQSVAEIGVKAFAGCQGLVRANIPRGISEVSDGMYSDCRRLKHIAVPAGVTKIGEWAFSHCWALKRVKLPDTLTQICNSAFRGCSNLNDVVIPDSVTRIADSAFEHCIQLQNIKVPDSAYPLGHNAFLYCPCEREMLSHEPSYSENEKLWQYRVYGTGVIVQRYLGHETSITVPETIFGRRVDGLEYAGMSVGWNKYTQHIEEITLPDSITKVRHLAFCLYHNLRRIDLPSTLTEIEYCAFAGCEKLEALVLPDGLERIDHDAFERCRSLKTITLPQRLSSLDPSAFKDCTGLTEIRVEQGNKAYRDIDGVLFSADGTVLMVYPSSRGGEEYRVPDGVKRIGDGAFSGCQDLRRLILPRGLEYFGCSQIGRWGQLTVLLSDEPVYLANVWGDTTGRLIISQCYSAKQWTGKKAAHMVTLGYAWGRYNGYSFPDDVAKENRSYMVKRRRDYFPSLGGDEYLLQCMIDDKIIRSKDFEILFEMYSDRTDIIAKLMEYRRRNYPQEDYGDKYMLD